MHLESHDHFWHYSVTKVELQCGNIAKTNCSCESFKIVELVITSNNKPLCLYNDVLSSYSFTVSYLRYQTKTDTIILKYQIYFS